MWLEPSQRFTSYCRDCNNQKCREYRQSHREQDNARHLRWYHAHREHALAYQKAHPEWKAVYIKKPRKTCEHCGEPSKFSRLCQRCRQKEFRKKFRQIPENRVKANAINRRRRAELALWYVKAQLTSYKTPLRPMDIPDGLAAAKAAQLKLNRLCKK
jgi:hypothetical protein